ncbi:hypothetical protein B0T22DRAFT_205440 [Podospora appendiculata]|uniref:Uncharacterized protein n=1 Tax=Podospora appendiculata TaxID=314037 RepID=A0AAE1C9Z3_9PEZI|nr:hypothetical protein B0T22DRAFT_205440 [Podospora appendiculata]
MRRSPILPEPSFTAAAQIRCRRPPATAVDHAEATHNGRNPPLSFWGREQSRKKIRKVLLSRTMVAMVDGGLLINSMIAILLSFSLGVYKTPHHCDFHAGYLVVINKCLGAVAMPRRNALSRPSCKANRNDAAPAPAATAACRVVPCRCRFWCWWL